MTYTGGQGQSGRFFPLIALRGLAVFPSTAVSLQIGRPQSLSAVSEALKGDGLMVAAAQKDLRQDNPQPHELFSVGTLIAVKEVTDEGNGILRAVVEGLARVRIVTFMPPPPHIRVAVEPLPEEAPSSRIEVEALAQSVLRRFEHLMRLSRQARDEETLDLSVADPARLADRIAARLAVKVEDKQALLEAVGLKERLEKLSYILHRETELLELERKIQQRVRRQLEKSQREYYLREQLKAIQRELGEEDEGLSEIEDFRARIRKCGMPQAVEEKALREVERLAKMPSHAAEAVVVRGYLEWLTSLPWSRRTEDRLDLAYARQVLDQDHYGLEKVKERILEFLAVRKLVQSAKGPILCLVGPPGVGKTSLARSVAKALGRQFVRVSLGGVRDEAEIRGHRRTYVGSMPGRIIQGMRQAGSLNPVFLLDEVDKMSADFRGDPAAALLEVLDPEQNAAFSDHYIEVPFDLSEVLFITTANTTFTIPRALLDRMETIFLPGYTEEEKVHIARRHLWPKQLAAHGLSPEMVTVSDGALRELIRKYTREAGVRNLERELASICRKVARDIAEGDGSSQPVSVTVSKLARFLGAARFRYGTAEAANQVGVCTGLGWTEYGGDVMAFEVTVMSGKGGLVLTGKLGEVMRESAQAAHSYIRSRAESLGIDARFHEIYDLHVHVLEGAVPKDGPSAGITMATAMISALTGIPVRRDVAMTGEITLRGRVLAVGGVREKVLAAHRAGITTMILPAENRADVNEVPANIRRRMRFVFVENMDQVLAVALTATVPAATGQRPGAELGSRPADGGSGQPAGHPAKKSARQARRRTD